MTGPNLSVGQRFYYVVAVFTYPYKIQLLFITTVEAKIMSAVEEILRRNHV